MTSADLDFVELYNCFPCVPKMARRAIDWPVDKPATVFGRLTFGGGPIGNYMSHAVVGMVEALRAERRFGLLFANGGFATHNHCIILGREPIPGAVHPGEFDFQDEAVAMRGRGGVPRTIEDYEGRATIETYTVLYECDRAPKQGVSRARQPTIGRSRGYRARTKRNQAQCSYGPVRAG